MFRDQCFMHLVRDAHGKAPRGAPGPEGDWEPLARLVAEMHVAVGGDAAGDELAARVWARALRRSYGSALRATGAPLDALPPSAAPFVRAAAAWRLWHLEGRSNDRDLTGWVARLDEVLADRTSPGLCDASADSDVPDRQEPWFEPAVDEQPLDTVPWFGPVSRALGPTPDAELAIVLLEAAVRAPAGTRAIDLAVEGCGHEVAEVRWTAVRALGVLDHTHPAVGPLESDPDPRVAARAVAVGSMAAPMSIVEPGSDPGGPPGPPP
jgi:hypothetical protein